MPPRSRTGFVTFSRFRTWSRAIPRAPGYLRISRSRSGCVRVRQNVSALRAISGNRADSHVVDRALHRARRRRELQRSRLQLVGHQASAATTDYRVEKVKPAVRTRSSHPARRSAASGVRRGSYDARDPRRTAGVALRCAVVRRPRWSWAIAQRPSRALSEATGSPEARGAWRQLRSRQATDAEEGCGQGRGCARGGQTYRSALGSSSRRRLDRPSSIGSTWSETSCCQARRGRRTQGACPARGLARAGWCPRPRLRCWVRALAWFARERRWSGRRRSRATSAASPPRSASEASATSTPPTTRSRTLRDRTNQASWLRESIRAAGLARPRTERGAHPEMSPAPDPFEYSPSDAEAMERLILPLLA